MKILQGICAAKGSAYGKIYIYNRNYTRPQKRSVADTESEQGRFKLARYIAVKELRILYERAMSELGGNIAMIFYIHQLMLSDDSFTDAVCSIISEKHVNAETAVAETCDHFADIFSKMSDGYMRERRADVHDVCERVIAILQSASQPYPKPSAPSVIVSKELSPSEILLCPRGLIKGLVLTSGAVDSHATMLAAKMHIPAVCRTVCTANVLFEADSALIDADNGAVYLDPSDDILEKFKQ